MDEDYYIEEDWAYESMPSDNLGLKRMNSYTVIHPADLEVLRNKIIEECMEFTFLPREEATIVLISYQWNIESIKDLWYNDVDENRKKCGLNINKFGKAELKNLGVMPNNTDCYICFAPKDENFFALNCNHFFCSDCWVYYVESKLDDWMTCISSSCPQQGCSLIVPEDIFKKFLSESKKKDFEKIIYKNFTDNNVDIKWCPAPDCGICIRSLIHSMKEITCECSTVFCFKCGKEGHRPVRCEAVEAWQQKTNSEGESVKWIKANTKQCPGCKKYIEKNQGCNHMTCTKDYGGCGHEFCWICLNGWKLHGNDYYNCNIYDSNKKKNEDDNQASYKQELDRYIWHYDRYMNHDRAQKLSIKLREQIDFEISEFMEFKNFPYEELRFLEEAQETIVRSRRILKNTYIFGYYMKEAKIRKLFEYNQLLLEKEVDTLHEMMENDTKQKMLKIDNFETLSSEWSLFRNNVINLYSVTQKYQERLLTEIENNMMEFIDFKALNI